MWMEGRDEGIFGGPEQDLGGAPLEYFSPVARVLHRIPGRGVYTVACPLCGRGLVAEFSLREILRLTRSKGVTYNDGRIVFSLPCTFSCRFVVSNSFEVEDLVRFPLRTLVHSTIAVTERAQVVLHEPRRQLRRIVKFVADNLEED